MYSDEQLKQRKILAEKIQKLNNDITEIHWKSFPYREEIAKIKKKHPRSYWRYKEYTNNIDAERKILEAITPIREEVANLTQKYEETFMQIDDIADKFFSNINKEEFFKVSGKSKLFHNFIESKRNCSSILEISDIIWNDEFDGLVDGIRESCIKEFAYCSRSTDALEVIAKFLDKGFKVVSSYKRERINDEYFISYNIEAKGVLIRVE